ncbi:MAG TPA: T9SS type A sorting domain-containing protein [Bacteroidota bacterium]
MENADQLRISTSRISFFVTCFSFFALISVRAQDTLWSGHIAFSEGRYDDAITAYQAALDLGTADSAWLADLIGTVLIRKDLGSIAPPDTHKIGAIFVTEFHADSGSGPVMFPDVTSEQKAVWLVYFGVFRQTLESFSGGAWTACFDTIEAVATYNTADSLKPDNPDHLNLEEFFFDRMTGFDSFVTFSNTRSPAVGLARRYPLLNGVLYGPDRGMAAINAGTHGFLVLLHEFFHIIEWVSNAISPTHGYTDANRGNFPDWTGTTEFDYYRWHFANTLPGVGWDRLNHRTRWIPFKNNREVLDSLYAIYSLIPFSDRQRADTLTADGIPLYNSDTSAAVALWEEAIALSPFHERALLELHDHYRLASPDTAKRDEVAERLGLLRMVTDFVTLDTLNKDLGKVIGMWHREDVGKSWNFREWDLSEGVTVSGGYEATFYYTRGFKGLDIDSVSILEDGIQMSLDAHVGFSGNVKTDITYELSIPDFKPASEYRLRAKVRGNGGVDSYGQVHVLATGRLSSIGASSSVPQQFSLRQNYPNPFNPATLITYDIPVSVAVELKVYDILGRVVALLAEGKKEAGRHAVRFNGSALPSGVYFYGLRAGEFTAFRKLVLMK